MARRDGRRSGADAGRGAGTPLELGSPPQSGRTGLGALGGRNSKHHIQKHIYTLLDILLHPIVFHSLPLPPIHPSCTGMTSTEVQETLREAMNNLIKHFHKPEQEVCGIVYLFVIERLWDYIFI